MGSHICQDCGDQVPAVPGYVHHCRVREQRRIDEAIAAARVDSEARLERELLQRTAAACAESISSHGYHVSVRVFAPYGVDDPQPDPLVDVWRSASPVAAGGGPGQ